MLKFATKYIPSALLCLLLANPAGAAQELEPLLHAIQIQDMQQLRQLLKTNRGVNEVVQGKTLLQHASATGNLELVTALVEAGANVNGLGSGKITAMMSAAYRGHLAVADYFIKQGADLRQEADNGYEAFDYALEGNHKELMLRLIEAWQEQTDLAYLAAVIRSDYAQVKQLNLSGANINAHNHTGYAALPMAVRLNDLAMVKLLMESGAEVNIGNDGNDEAIPLNQAARGGNIDVAKYLLSQGADVNKVNARGLTALQLAVFSENIEMIDLLLSAGAKTDTANRDNFTAFDWAYQTGNQQALSSLLSAVNPHHPLLAAMRGEVGVMTDVTAIDKASGFSKLHMAARFGHIDLVKHLLSRGADVDAVSLTGYKTTALMDAGRNGFVEVGKVLIAAGADVIKGDVNGDPAINWTTYYGHQDYAELLLAAGADPMQANKDGYTAVRTAREQGHTVLLSLLQQHITSSD